MWKIKLKKHPPTIAKCYTEKEKISGILTSFYFIQHVL